MKKMIFGLCVLVIFLLIFSFAFRSTSTGNAIGSASGSSSPLVKNACEQAPFNTDSNAQLCGKGCCFGDLTCYKDQVCCNADEDGDSAAAGGIYFCKKRCDVTKGQQQCGEVCCDIKAGEVCREQGLGDSKHGVCLKAEQAKNGCDLKIGESACPPKGETKECCASNQDCKSKYIRIPYTFLGNTIWGCSVNPKKAGGCRSDIFCPGTEGQFKEYAVCCKKGVETCALHPDGQPYCYSQKSQNAKTMVSWTDSLRSFWGWS